MYARYTPKRARGIARQLQREEWACNLKDAATTALKVKLEPERFIEALRRYGIGAVAHVLKMRSGGKSMGYRMLIIDDEMSPEKGYGSIEEWFPRVFEIDEARFFVSGNPATASALSRLTTVRYDVILVDYCLVEEGLDGPELVAVIRGGLKGFTSEAVAGGLNRNAYIIGVSTGWVPQAIRLLERLIKRQGLTRGLDGATAEDGSIPLQLRKELQNFLVSREQD
jgi:hypothetical protein